MNGFRKAQRRRVYLKIGLMGPSGAGKTMSSLLLAYGLTGDWGKVALVDTENGSGELYVGAEVDRLTIGEYSVLTLEPPFSPDKYVQAIRLAEREGFQALILDSISHAWDGEGGIQDQKSAREGRGINSWTAWRFVTPMHNEFVSAMLQSKLDLIATMRSKMEYVQTVEDGKTVVKKVGMSPIQRPGMEYEFTVVFDLDTSHQAEASKDRTNLYKDRIFRISPETGRQLEAWRQGGVDAPAPKPFEPPPEPPKTGSQRRGVSFDALTSLMKELNLTQEQVLAVAGRTTLRGMTQAEVDELVAKLRGAAA